MTHNTRCGRASAVWFVVPLFFVAGAARAACSLASSGMDDCATVVLAASVGPLRADASIRQAAPSVRTYDELAQTENAAEKKRRPVVPGAAADGAALLTFSVNPPNVGNAPKIIPADVDTTATPALVVERESTAGNLNGSNATLMVGTSARIEVNPTWMNNIYSELEIKDVTASGQGGYGEATRSRCDIDASVTHSTDCWGLSALSVGTNARVPVGNIGVESEVDRGFSDAPAPASLSAAQYSVSYLASSGGGWAGPRIADAAFMVNPGSISGFQAGFTCPKDGGGDPKQTPQDVIHWACFYAGDKAPWAIDISNGKWTTGQIHGVNFDLDPIGNVWATSAGLTGAPVASYPNQVSYGGVTTTNTAKCGSLAGAAGCVEINVAGKMRWMPYF